MNDYAGGMPQTGAGTIYKIIAVLETAEDLSFDYIWVNKECGKPKVNSLSYVDGRKLKKGDTICIQYGIQHFPPNSPMAQMSNPIIKAAPFFFKGEALIGYSIHGVEKYFEVRSFRRTATINYQ